MKIKSFYDAEEDILSIDVAGGDYWKSIERPDVSVDQIRFLSFEDWWGRSIYPFYLPGFGIMFRPGLIWILFDLGVLCTTIIASAVFIKAFK